MNLDDFKAALDEAVTKARAGLAAEVAGLMTTVADLNADVTRLEGTVRQLEQKLDGAGRPRVAGGVR